MKKGAVFVCAKDGCGAFIDPKSDSKCARCLLVHYCSRSCQKADREKHKPECKPENSSVKRYASAKPRNLRPSVPRNIPTSPGTAFPFPFPFPFDHPPEPKEGDDDGDRKDIIEEFFRGTTDDIKTCEECPICCELLVDALSPCPGEQSHRYCRTCVVKMQEHGLPTCPLCRAPMQDAEEVFYSALQLLLRADRAPLQARRDLRKEGMKRLHQVLKVDLKHAEALYTLAVLFDNAAPGATLENNAKKAVRWYEKAAEAGSLRSMCNLGAGLCQKKDFLPALLWYTKAAEQGFAPAQNSVGSIFMHDMDMPEPAEYWFTQAADQVGDSLQKTSLKHHTNMY
jgi:hypothetical protein